MKQFLSIFFLLIGVFGFSQQTDVVDFKHCSADVHFDTSQSKVFGEVDYTFEILKDVDSIFLDAVDMRFERVELIPRNKKSDLIYRGTVPNRNDGKKFWVVHDFKKGQEYSLSSFFISKPKKALYFIDWKNASASTGQVWTQGQGKYTSNWLPSIDDMNDKIEFDLSINFEKGYEVISNGRLIKREEAFGKTVWHYDMKQPMSSYLVALAIGKYNKKVEYSKSGIPLEMYYYPEDSLKVEPTYRYTKQMFDFLEEEIGVPYPWQNYKQVPVKDFLYAGMENTSCTIFSDAFVVDSIAFVDKNYVNVNAHELVHQWFGNLVTETSGTHHWLQEGFATYYALLAERNVFGDDYYYWQLYEYAQELQEQDKAGGGTSLLNPKSSSTTFYKRGAWVLHLLREKVGDKAFKKAVKSYLKSHAYQNVVTEDFISEAEKFSKQDLGAFVDSWLISEKFHYDLALESLKQSAFIQEYLMVDCEAYTSKCEEYLGSGISDEAKRKIIFQNPNQITAEHFKNPIKVRQAIAQSLSRIPSELKSDYETLLNDNSYITIEAALFNLWKNFPQERTKYLNQTKGIIGFNDKNVRILWLTLALLTENFESENQSKYLDELIGYTSPNYGFETRINAFQYLTQIQACNDECKAHLQQATTHHNWQMVKFAKSLQSQMEQ